MSATVPPASRPPVSVVMPFAGGPAEGAAAVRMLRSLQVRDGDQLILADNTDAAAAIAAPNEGKAPLERVDASGGLRSPGHARNAGAARAEAEWILFLDADITPPPDLLDTYFADPVDDTVGALAGEITALAGADTVAARYGAARNFLSQRAHLSHPYLPRAVAANLMVRRKAFEALQGFREDIRAAEDTDFCWRLQRAGWGLELRERAAVGHRYRGTVRELRRQWRGYAAGRAWLAREYPDFRPQPAVRRAVRRALSRAQGRAGAGTAARVAEGGTKAKPEGSAAERAAFLALDVVLALDELIGLRASNLAKRGPSR